MKTGQLIKQIRTARGMSQAELGVKVGLTGDRIQKYENGARSPKEDMLIKIAAALDVNPIALSDPCMDTDTETMHTLFKLVNAYNLQLTKDNDNYALVIDTNCNLHQYIAMWYDALQSQTESEYYNWQWQYPDSAVQAINEIKKKAIMDKMNELQKELDDLNNPLKNNQ